LKKKLFIFFLFVSYLCFSQSYGIITTDLNSRKSAGGEKLRVIKKGQTVEILQIDGSWYFVRDLSVNKKGWVSGKYILKNIGILKTDANSRKSPGGKKLRVIKSGQAVEVIEKKGNWVFVRDISVNKKGWVSASLISKNTVVSVNNKMAGNKTKVSNSPTVSVSKNNDYNSEKIIETRLTNMGILWKWRNFKQNKRENIYIRDTDKFLETVNSYMGVPYAYGGNSRSGIDCSGLIYRGLQSVGYRGERLNAQMWAQSGRLIANKSSLRKGDLVCFTNTTGANKLVQHIAIYIGNNKFLHAPSSGKRVSLADINDPYYWGEKFIFGVRLNR